MQAMNDAQRKLLRDLINEQHDEANRLEALVRDGAQNAEYLQACADGLRSIADRLSKLLDRVGGASIR